MNDDAIDIRQYADLFPTGLPDLSEFVSDSGETESGIKFVQFILPLSILPLDKINKEAFDRHRAEIKLIDAGIVKDSIAIFDMVEKPTHYYLTAYEL